MLKDSLLSKLNEDQLKAVLHQTGPMLVTAGPGSGKTHVITTRLIYMIHVEKIPAEKIAVITFTKEAAKSMRSRFQQSSHKNENVSFGTFHSFYYQILRSSSKYSQYHLIQENEKKYIISKIVDLKEENKEQFIESLIKVISYYKNTLDIENAIKNEELSQDQFLDYFHLYEEEKIKRLCIDFDDMLYLSMKLLEEDRSLLKMWQKRFDYYLVDEFQDCNFVQYHILKLLASKRNIFAVGDDDQSIYGFRGAKTQIMAKFIKDYPDLKIVNLGINYRCAIKIVNASLLVINENKDRIKKSLSAVREDSHDEYIKVIPWGRKSEMFQYFIDLFKNIAKEELVQNALLFRTNQEMQMFAVRFMKSNIPFSIRKTNISIYDHFIVKDIMAFMDAADGMRKREIYLSIINKPKRGIGREAFEYEMVDLDKVSEYYKSSFSYNGLAIKEVERLKKQLQCMKKMSMPLRIKYIRNAFGYEKYLHDRANGNLSLLNTWIELLDWLQEDLAETLNMSEWRDRISKYENIHRTYDMERAIKNQGIQLLTIHGSKGLEFDHCFIMNVNEGVFPKYRLGEKLSPEQVEEERRIFYVGMTRAKKTLELHYLTGTKERPKLPSRFIRKLL